jgi:hypothetical protein
LPEWVCQDKAEQRDVRNEAENGSNHEELENDKQIARHFKIKLVRHTGQSSWELRIL